MGESVALVCEGELCFDGVNILVQITEGDDPTHQGILIYSGSNVMDLY